MSNSQEEKPKDDPWSAYSSQPSMTGYYFSDQAASNPMSSLHSPTNNFSADVPAPHQSEKASNTSFPDSGPIHVPIENRVSPEPILKKKRFLTISKSTFSGAEEKASKSFAPESKEIPGYKDTGRSNTIPGYPGLSDLSRKPEP
ncbi:Oidioi.mRNA.OKI2018_I69.chr1.g269.t2.cds [Oikopleura dioica]|uniref:Oidioi.mRNA.OKI2018_I69.chr1.g269.t2.cds n=1 Tax=Oikopleura dioica TaxID=34765 RepID=A0ABN7SRI3_OIKDI|nr:Oidioi.mRNA.OKI2018_I69.chr1.g269.t2.cds [Oikopleura dioica]